MNVRECQLAVKFGRSLTALASAALRAAIGPRTRLESVADTAPARLSLACVGASASCWLVTPSARGGRRERRCGRVGVTGREDRARAVLTLADW